MQTSLKRDVQFVGIGLHSGRPARMTLKPATAGSGVRFCRVDVTDRDPFIPARFDLVSDTQLNTRLTNAGHVSVSTVEHLMAAIAGTGLHNVLVEIDGPEVPIMDGSARRFVHDILMAGLVTTRAPLRAWKVDREITFEDGGASATLRPSDAFTIDFEIDFSDPAIGRQARRLDMANGAFLRELADCRTFCRRAEVDYMQAHGLALGGSLDNAVVVDGAEVLNPGGFRRTDECVRHKMLDALGDLALAGAPVLGAYEGRRAGHGVTNRLLRKAFATPGALRLVEVTPEIAARLPGSGLLPADLAAVG
ncbi:UDP-3-O-acyl-N-acetylglucosamine deacetylase [Halovulum dunhuangense]|uniref:UDP-3-O-acyl-N-acetylglucosamine deacetylase n=1 Tax=Halovulum dunhuangense TaxID=1505036 RepID=UPI00148C848D